METSSFELLEYASLKAIIGRQISSNVARRILEELMPSTDVAELEDAHKETAEAVYVLNEAASMKNVNIRFSGLPEVDQALGRIGIEGASLDGKEIYDLLQWLDRAAELRASIGNAGEHYPLLARRAAQLVDLRPVLRSIAGKIHPNGTLTDQASVALERIRRGMERQREAIQHSLEKFLRLHKDDGVLQDDFVTIRSERFVIPLVAGQRSKIPGVIHAASGTGATLFVEPMETIALNNELVRLTEEEMRETHRILRELTETLREHAAAIRTTVQTMGALEFTFAKARFGKQFRCVVPTFGERLHLDAARHPILEDVLRKEGKRVVPVSFTMDRMRRTLLITGPNTGGKTVTMKTAGLLSLMAQSGIPVPCEEAEFPVFEKVLADIGDNQSIAESLSSFSSHVSQIREMLKDATPDSLVLLDELGRATDPEEGGALGIAVLEKFREYGAFTLASTHLMPLKVWGATTDGVVQASMGFNEAEFTPTYQLLTGAPGRSAGLAIASKLGLPKALVERARQAMTSSERDIAGFLSELHRRLDEVKAKQLALAEERVRLERETRLEREELRKAEEAKRKEMERKAEAALAAFEKQARETLEHIQQSASTSRKAADLAVRKVIRTQTDFKHEVQQAVAAPAAEKRAALIVDEGDRVRLSGIREPARVRRLLPNGMVDVEVGIMKMRVPYADITELLPDGPTGPKLPSGVTFQGGPTWDTVTKEINIIGQRAEEARDAVEKFLDIASLASVDRVRIVHGHGMGVLKRAIGELLQRSPLVTRHYAATPAEGGNGATIAELK
ncbi:MAG TPA: endonuclease MutS2 [Bryobacteraceae bacterium]|nr:endonuclease MutS2 [Bryobacteraceae bacterium]